MSLGAPRRSGYGKAAVDAVAREMLADVPPRVAAVETAVAPGADGDLKATVGGVLTNIRPGRIDAKVRGLSPSASASANTALLASLLAEAKAERKPVYIGDGVFPLTGINLTYEGDTPTPSVYGYRGAPLQGNGPRATILTHAAGSSTPLVRIAGSAAASDTSHTGKVIGSLVEGMELRGSGMTTGNTTPLVEMTVFESAALRDLYITQGGGDGIQLRRPERTASRDDYSHGFEIENVKVFQCGGDAVSTPDNHAVGYGTLISVQAHSNGGYGFDLISAGITLVGSAAYANTLGGLRSRNSQGGSISTAQGLMLLGSRFEGNAGIEVDLQGGSNPVLIGCTLLGTHANGPDVLVIGNSGANVIGAMVLGGMIAGNGGASGTAGQRAVRIGANASATIIDNPYIVAAQFSLAYAGGDPVLAVHDGGTRTVMLLEGRERTTRRFSTNSSLAMIATSQLYTQAFRKWAMYADGRQEYGSGSVAPNLDTGYVTGTPEGAVTANVGSLRWSTDGNLYLKKTGTGDTGWKAVVTEP